MHALAIGSHLHEHGLCSGGEGLISGWLGPGPSNLSSGVRAHEIRDAEQKPEETDLNSELAQFHRAAFMSQFSHHGARITLRGHGDVRRPLGSSLGRSDAAQQQLGLSTPEGHVRIPNDAGTWGPSGSTDSQGLGTGRNELQEQQQAASSNSAREGSQMSPVYTNAIRGHCKHQALKAWMVQTWTPFASSTCTGLRLQLLACLPACCATAFRSRCGRRF